MTYGYWRGRWFSPTYPEDYNGTISFLYQKCNANYISIHIKYLGNYYQNKNYQYCGVIKKFDGLPITLLNIFIVEKNIVKGRISIPDIGTEYLTFDVRYCPDDDNAEECCLCTIL